MNFSTQEIRMMMTMSKVFQMHLDSVDQSFEGLNTSQPRILAISVADKAQQMLAEIAKEAAAKKAAAEAPKLPEKKGKK